MNGIDRAGSTPSIMYNEQSFSPDWAQSKISWSMVATLSLTQKALLMPGQRNSAQDIKIKASIPWWISRGLQPLNLPTLWTLDSGGVSKTRYFPHKAENTVVDDWFKSRHKYPRSVRRSKRLGGLTLAGEVWRDRFQKWLAPHCALKAELCFFI